MSTVLFMDAVVFDGSSAELIEGASVYVENGTIREVSDRRITAAADVVVDVAGRTMTPGLIDLHTHFHITDVNVLRAARRRTEYVACWTVAQLAKSLARGFTSIRDAGGSDPSYARAIERGIIPGPRFFTSGRALSQTGGHGDFRDPEDYPSWDICPMCHGGQERFVAIVDSPDEVRKAVREELRKGVHQIKLIASGGVSSKSDPLGTLQFSDEEILTAVAEAKRHGSYVFAHCHPAHSTRRAVDLGVRCIEHASFLDEDTARHVVAKGAYIVPTLAVAKALLQDGKALGYPDESLQKLEGLLDAMFSSLEVMQRTGVKLGFGTDLLGPHQKHQCNEFLLRREVQQPIDILRSATSIGAEILGMEGKLGCIAPGAHADLLIVDGNPLTDIGLLARDGAAISTIMKDGRFIKREHELGI